MYAMRQSLKWQFMFEWRISSGGHRHHRLRAGEHSQSLNRFELCHPCHHHIYQLQRCRTMMMMTRTMMMMIRSRLIKGHVT